MALRPPHAPRPGRSLAPRLGCYGKLPFDLEYLRFNLDSAIGRWIVQWVDAAFDTGQPRDPDREVRAIIVPPGADEAAAVLIRPSHDSHPRANLVAVSAAFPAGVLADAWHLAPLCCAPLWSPMVRGVIEAPTPGREAFPAVLEAAAHPLDDVEFARERFAVATAAPLKRPWRALTGHDEAGASAAARALVVLCDQQRAEGTGLAIRLPNAGCSVARLRGDPTLVTAAWVRLIGAGGTRSLSAPPAIIEMWRRGAAHWESLYVFGRPVTGADLAALLADGAPVSADALDSTALHDAELPPIAQALLANLTENAAVCLADLWR